MPKCPQCGYPISSFSEYHKKYYEKNKETLKQKSKELRIKKKKLAGKKWLTDGD